MILQFYNAPPQLIPDRNTAGQVFGRAKTQIVTRQPITDAATYNNSNKNLFHSKLSQAMNSISRSITQAIVPAVRRAASSTAPAAAQSAREGFKLVEVRPLLLPLKLSRNLLNMLCCAGAVWCPASSRDCRIWRDCLLSRDRGAAKNSAELR